MGLHFEEMYVFRIYKTLLIWHNTARLRGHYSTKKVLKFFPTTLQIKKKTSHDCNWLFLLKNHRSIRSKHENQIHELSFEHECETNLCCLLG